MLVFLDANVIVSDRFLNNKRWIELDEAVNDGRVTVAIPEIAVLEATARLRAAYHEHARSIRATARRASRAVRDLVEAAAAQAEQEGDAYGPALRALLTQHHVEVLPAPEIPHDVLAGRAIERHRPFDENGNGYRDTLHWFSLLDRAEYEDEVVLVSGDKRAFYAQRASAAIHPHLAADITDRGLTCTFTLAASITDVTVPGIFLPDELAPDDLDLDLEAALLSELNAGVLPQLELRPEEIGLPEVDAVQPLQITSLTIRSHRIRQYYLDGGTDIQAEVRADLTVRTSTLLPQPEQEDLVEGTQRVAVLIALETSTSSRGLGSINITGVRPVTPVPRYSFRITSETLNALARLQKQQIGLSSTASQGLQNIVAAWPDMSFGARTTPPSPQAPPDTEDETPSN